MKKVCVTKNVDCNNMNTINVKMLPHFIDAQLTYVPVECINMYVYKLQNPHIFLLFYVLTVKTV